MKLLLLIINNIKKLAKKYKENKKKRDYCDINEYYYTMRMQIIGSRRLRYELV